jgi:hypothetical protein
MSFSHSPRIVTDGLVLCLDAANPQSYPGSGTSWADLSGNGNTGTLINGPTFSSGNSGSIVFDGVNDYVVLDSVISLTDFTATAVYNVQSLNSGWAMFFGNTDTDSFIAISSDDGGKLRTQDKNSTNSDLSYVSVLNRITMLQVVQSGNDNTWYINGKIVGTSSNSVYGGVEFTRMVHYANGDPLGIWSGKYYYANLYNRALSASEVLQNYEAVKSRFGL